MSEMNEEYRAKRYRIPRNFIDEGRIINGMIKTRHAIEGLLFCAITALPAYIITSILGLPLKTKIMTVLIAGLPLLMLGIVGVNDDPLSVFLKYWKKYRKNKRLMLYNGKARFDVERQGDEILNRELPRDKIMAAYQAWKDSRASQYNDILIEGVDFVFNDDIEREKAQKAKKKKQETKPKKTKKLKAPPEKQQLPPLSESKEIIGEGEFIDDEEIIGEGEFIDD